MWRALRGAACGCGLLLSAGAPAQDGAGADAGVGNSGYDTPTAIPEAAPIVDASGPAGEAEYVRELPDQIVTAQKVEQTLQEVPASVSTLNADLIRETGAIDFPDLAAYTPNIDLRLTPWSSDIYIRGFGTASTNAGFEPSVAAVVDGVYYGRSNFMSAVFHDLDRVEVLRGPQGTLFGKNSSAGVLNIVTMEPQPVFAGTWELLWGDYGEMSFRPALQLPLMNDELSIRLSGNYASDDGQLYNTALDRPEAQVDQQTTRVRLHYELPNEWTFDFGAFHSEQGLNNNLFQATQQTPDMLALVQTYDPRAETGRDNFLISSDLPARAEVTFDSANITFAHTADRVLAIDDMTFTMVLGWAESVSERREFDADFTAVPVISDTLLEPSPFTQWSTELRFSGSHPDLLGYGGKFSFVVGGFYYESKMNSSDVFRLEDLGAAAAYLVAANAGGENAFLPGGIFGRIGGGLAGPINTLADLLDLLLDPVIGDEQVAYVGLDQRTSANAAYGQGEWKIADDWSLIGGLRIGQEEKSGDSFSRATSVLIPIIASQEDHVSQLSRKEREISPKAGIKWAPDRNLTVFATWSRGFKSGGYNALPLTPQNLEFEPERATSVEMGVKARLLGGSMRVSATAFNTRFEDLQVSTYSGGNFFILNAAEARSRGMEVDMLYWPPVDGLQLMVSGGFVDAQYSKYPDAPAYADYQSPAQECQLASLPVDLTEVPSQCVTQDLSGRPLAFTPRWSASLVPSYTMLFGPQQASLSFAVDVLYRSGRFLDIDLDPRTWQPTTTEVNARVTLGNLSRDITLTLSARNLTDQVQYEQILDQALAPGNFAGIRSDRGRFYSAHLQYRF